MDSSPQTHLKALHQLHLQLHELKQQLERGPKLVKARQNAVLQKQTELDAQREKQKQLKMAADKKSLNLKTNEAKIVELGVKLNQAASNREFDIFRSQIQADKMANSVLEDEILGALEQVDASQTAIKTLEQELATCKSEESRVANEVAQKQAGLKSSIASLEGKIAVEEKILPGDVLIVYRRLVGAHGAGALAEVNNKVCSSCYVQLPPQTLVVLKSGQLLFCKTCGRLLYPGDDD